MRPTVSVCVAVHNGEKHLKEQLDSIVAQLEENDELLIFDDSSTDKSATIIESYLNAQTRVLRPLINQGVNRAFEALIFEAKNGIIVLSDQDDVWPPNRVSELVSILEQGDSTCAVGNQIAIDSIGNIITHSFASVKDNGPRKVIQDIYGIVIGQSPYYGCCMAFSNKIRDVLLPFPCCTESHDLWIAICSLINGKNIGSNSVVTSRRVHGKNISIIKRPLHQAFRSRVYFVVHIATAIFRKIKKAANAGS
jgi:glycosyltransferase involved in cell wall biosynthesis